MRPACARSSNAGLRVGRSAMNTSSWTPGSSLEWVHTPTALAMRPGVLRRLRDSRQHQARATPRASNPGQKRSQVTAPTVRNFPDASARYTKVAVTLHWLIAALVVAPLILGPAGDGTHNEPARAAAP